MKQNAAPVLVLLAGALAIAAGCSAESKAEAALAKHEGAFRVCQEEMEKMKAARWEHRCALVASMALDASLADTGLGDAKIEQMRDAWLDSSGYKDLYVPPEKRTAPPAPTPNPATTRASESR